MHVLIIGGGIGGLATALSLQKAGIEATVSRLCLKFDRLASASICCRMPSES